MSSIAEKFREKMAEVVARWATASAEAQTKILAEAEARKSLDAAQVEMDSALLAEQEAFNTMMSFRDDLLDGGIDLADIVADPPFSGSVEPQPVDASVPALIEAPTAPVEQKPAEQADGGSVEPTPVEEPIIVYVPVGEPVVASAPSGSVEPQVIEIPLNEPVIFQPEPEEAPAPAQEAPFLSDVPEPPVLSGEPAVDAGEAQAPEEPPLLGADAPGGSEEPQAEGQFTVDPVDAAILGIDQPVVEQKTSE